jgi:hypothetical protein
MGMAAGTDALVVVLADTCLAAARRCQARGGDLCGDLLTASLTSIDSLLAPAGVPCGQSYTAELHRLRGELLLARDGLAAAPAARACFRQAMVVGHEKGARAWELRAATSLVRLLARQGGVSAAELAEARGCLCRLYAQFTEGFDFPDLQDAAALIGETG